MKQIQQWAKKLKAAWCKNNAHIPFKSETAGQHQLHYTVYSRI